MAMTPKTSKHKIDIFKVLNKINTKQFRFYDELTDEELKSVHPYVLMKWMGGTQDPQQILVLNHFANPYIFPLAKHKELLLEVLVACSPGTNRRYKWVKQKKSSSLPSTINVIRRFFGYSTSKSIDVLPLLQNEDIISYGEQLGLSKEQMQKVKRELKNRS